MTKNANHVDNAKLIDVDWSRVPTRHVDELTAISDEMVKATINHSFFVAVMKYFLYFTLFAGTADIIVYRVTGCNPFVLLFGNLAVTAVIGAALQIRALLELKFLDVATLEYNTRATKIIETYSKKEE